MKAEEFDQYVRAQFENETVVPPANLEGAVFAALAGETRKRRIVAAAAIGLMVTASATALWMNNPASVQPGATKSVPTEIIVPVAAEPAAAVEAPAPPAESESSIVSTTSQDPKPKASATADIPASDQPATSAPVAMDEVTLRALSGVEQETTAQPQLQQLEGEKWVLPATVTVKD
jgi:hypothetical protein